MVEHKLEGRHLRVGNNGKGGTTVGVGLPCAVKHETLDVLTLFEHLEAFLVGDADEDNAGDDDVLYFTTMAVAVDVRLLLACNIGFVA